MQLDEKIEQGKVIEVISFNKAKIQVRRGKQCVGCSQRSLCYPFGSDYMIIEASNPLNARVGDNVEVLFEVVTRNQAIGILYLIPLVFFIIGSVAGNYLNPLHNKDLSGSLGGIFFLIISFLLIYFYNRGLVRKKPALQPRIIRIIPELDKNDKGAGEER